jgi:hypothetical protein
MIGHRLARQSLGALAERSGSERWPEQTRRVRAVSARLEGVWKFKSYIKFLRPKCANVGLGLVAVTDGSFLGMFADGDTIHIHEVLPS